MFKGLKFFEFTSSRVHESTSLRVNAMSELESLCFLDKLLRDARSSVADKKNFIIKK